MSQLAAALLLAAALAQPLADPAQEARARALEQEIRCVACENEPISQSTAEIATDMRGVVRERIQAGDTDAEIRTYFADRYGEFVLFRPRFSATNWPLWIAPLALLALGLVAMLSLRGRARDFTPELDEER